MNDPEGEFTPSEWGMGVSVYAVAHQCLLSDVHPNDAGLRDVVGAVAFLMRMNEED